MTFQRARRPEQISARRSAIMTGAREMLAEKNVADISLLPLHGPAHGVVTAGLKYPLHKETLYPGSTRGVSNEFSEGTAEVRLSDGILLAVQPGPEEDA